MTTFLFLLLIFYIGYGALIIFFANISDFSSKSFWTWWFMLGPISALVIVICEFDRCIGWIKQHIRRVKYIINKLSEGFPE